MCEKTNKEEVEDEVDQVVKQKEKSIFKYKTDIYT